MSNTDKEKFMVPYIFLKYCFYIEIKIKSFHLSLLIISPIFSKGNAFINRLS